MSLIARYISSSVLSAFFVVMLLLFGLHVILWFIGEIGTIGRGDYHLIDAFQFVLLQSPYRLCEFFPIASLVGGLIGLGLLASNNELVVMRTSGVSIGKICAIVLSLAFCLSIVVLLILEFIAPQAVHFAENKKYSLLYGEKALRMNKGIWFRDVDNYVYVEKIEKDNVVKSVNRYEFNDDYKLEKVTYAKIGVIQDSKWKLSDVSETIISDDKITSNTAKEIKMPFDMPLSLLKFSYVNPDELTNRQLNAFVNDQVENNVNAGIYALMYWQRLFQPLNTLVMMLLAVPIIFGPLRSSSIGLRIMSGSSIGFVFYIVSKLFGQASVVYKFSPLFASLLPSVIFLIIGIYLLRRYK